MNTFQLPSRLIYGGDGLERLRTLAGRRTLLVTDRVVGTSDTARYVIDLLETANLTVFMRVQPNPTTEVIADAVGAFVAAAPQVIVALGGGSVLDTAKAMLHVARSHTPDLDVELWAIPTTSGSGSEATSFAVVTDVDTHVKVPLVAHDMVPSVAILDARATLGVPPAVAADTGMDVITHAVEAYVSTTHNDFSDALAEKALQLACAWLERCHTDPRDGAARQRMHHASYLAGAAFENAGLGITHSLAHAVGGQFPVAHGRLNALLLPHVIAFNAQRDSRTRARTAWLAHLIGAPAAADVIGMRSFVNAIVRLRRQLGIGATIVHEGIPMEDYRRAIPTMARAALLDGCTRTNPVSPSLEDLTQLLRMVGRT